MVRLRDGKSLAGMDSKSALSGAARAWYYDDVDNILWVRFPDQGAASTMQVEK